MKGVIYCLENKINGSKYIGQTVQLKVRLKEHIQHGNTDKPKYVTQSYK